jgi:hypothetical protein
MLFVLLWTSTFLHDIAEPDQAKSAQPSHAANVVLSLALTTPTENQTFEGHQHDALVGFKFTAAGTPLQVSQFVPLAANNSWTGSLQFLSELSAQRGPPIAQALAKPRLHLINRVLLI